MLYYFKKYYLRIIIIVALLVAFNVFFYAYVQKEKISYDNYFSEFRTASSEITTQGTFVQTTSSATKKTNTAEEYNKTCDPFLRLVNADNAIDETYTVETVVYQNLEIDKRIVTALDNMLQAAKKDGVNLKINSGYRTWELQETLFEREKEGYINKGFSEEEAYNLAKRSVAVPGTSEHQIGLAVDFGPVSQSFKNTNEYSWLSEHCTEYGFIERYPDGKQDITGIIFEPWHYRYVGSESKAKEITESGLCFEEYVNEQTAKSNQNQN